jgi:glucans biosynthesis protein
MSKSETAITRRGLLVAAGSTAALALMGSFADAAMGPAEPFSRAMVLDRARELAKNRYRPPANDLPANFANLTYDQYRDIRFRPDVQLWDQNLPFRLQLFHRGLYSKERVGIALVGQDGARNIIYSSDMFGFGEQVPRPLPPGDIGFAGIRLLGLINKPDRYDEVAVFQGASYFRALGRGQHFGISSRGLALKTAEPEGEEFPFFRQFWIETPGQNASTLVVHALLDSPSVAGAYRFTIRPGLPTVMGGDHLPARRPHQGRPRAADLHVLFQRQWPAERRRLPAGSPRFRRAADV